MKTCSNLDYKAISQAEVFTYLPGPGYMGTRASASKLCCLAWWSCSNARGHTGDDPRGRRRPLRLATYSSDWTWSCGEVQPRRLDRCRQLWRKDTAAPTRIWCQNESHEGCGGAGSGDGYFLMRNEETVGTLYHP